MSEPNDTREELEQTAIMLEQILEVMPDDLFTLRALYETSLKLEQPEKAFDTLSRLDDQARAMQNSEMISFVLNQYASIAEDSPDVLRRISRLEEAQNVLGLIGEDHEEPTLQKPASSGEGRMEAEMALAWELFQDEQLTQEEYSSVLHDLTEMSSHEMGVPVTVLHILHDRQFSRFERLMTHLCQKSDVPIISLSQFDDNEEVAELLPIDFISKNGALPFAEVSGDILLAMLNPFDRELVSEAENASGRRCHPYLVQPNEYDQQLAKIKKARAA